MTQKEFIEELYATGKFKNKKDIKIFMEIFEEIFKNRLITGEKIIIKNIGTFKLEKSIRKRYLPKEKIVVEREFTNIKFKVSNNIKKTIKKNEKENN